MLRKFRSRDPLPWALWLALSRLRAKLKSALLARLFHAPGLYLGRGSVVIGAKHISFGCNISANSGLWLEAVTSYGAQHFTPRIAIGDSVCFSDGVHISSIDRIIIKNNVLMGSKVYISDHNHGLYKGAGQSHPEEPPALRLLGGGGPVEIGENVWIGDNVILVGPATIGDAAILAANSVIRGNVPAQTIVAGAPAKVIKHFNPTTCRWERT